MSEPSPQYPPQPAAYWYPPPSPAQPQWSGMAIASLAFGLLGITVGWCLLGIPGIVAVILGAAGVHETANGVRRGRSLAWWGIALGSIPAAVGLYEMALLIANGAR